MLCPLRALSQQVYSLNKLNVYKVAMRILLEEENCDIIGNARLLLECIKGDIESHATLNTKQQQANSFAISSNSIESTLEASRAICDEVLRDSIASCREPDYKMELAKLLSNEAKIELYIEIGKLSNAQMLACNLNRPDYVSSIIEKASELNQNHVKTVCQLWLAKHDSQMAPETSHQHQKKPHNSATNSYRMHNSQSFPKHLDKTNKFNPVVQ